MAFSPRLPKFPSIKPVNVKKSLFAILLMLGMSWSVCGQAQGQSEISHYVVIGVFAVHNNAIRYTDYANKLNFSAQYAINPSRNLYYVYLLESPDRKRAFSFMLKIRVETEFKDSWVFSGKLGQQVAEEPVVEEKPAEPVAIEEVKEPVTIEEVPVKEETVAVEEEKKPEGKPFYFKLTNSGKEVLGEIHVQESLRASQYQAFNGNEVVYLPTPRNAAKTWIVSVQAPGYRPVDLTIDYENPAELSSGSGAQNEAIIPIELVRSKRGDFIEFNRVRFFGNSAIFQPESKLELDGLVELMKEQPKYKISVHGHCNGKQSRNVALKGASSEFFETNIQNTRETVSAKQLTQYRADLVKEYLVSQGIDAKRIKTKAEGGNAMIYPPTGALSGFNDRIEVEIKKGK